MNMRSEYVLFQKYLMKMWSEHEFISEIPQCQDLSPLVSQVIDQLRILSIFASQHLYFVILRHTSNKIVSDVICTVLLWQIKLIIRVAQKKSHYSDRNCTWLSLWSVYQSINDLNCFQPVALERYLLHQFYFQIDVNMETSSLKWYWSWLSLIWGLSIIFISIFSEMPP